MQGLEFGDSYLGSAVRALGFRVSQNRGPLGTAATCGSYSHGP